MIKDHINRHNYDSSYAYDPFGNIISQSETIPQPFTFIGQYGVMTEPNGFYYMKARYYDPQVGRFISEDPIGFDGGDVNLYAYVGNNPIMGVDPWGRCGQYLDTFTNWSAGLGDVLLLGAGPYIRQVIDVPEVDRSSTAYTVGSYTSLAFGLARLTYAAAAKGISLLASSGTVASVGRESLRSIFRLGIGTNWRQPNLTGYISDAALRAAAGRTNPFVNAYGAGVTAAGAINPQDRR